MKKCVLTGGPSVGKTTVIELLASRGYTIVPEAARMIIEEERVKQSNILPYKNIQAFQQRVAERQFELEAKARGNIIFYDRGIVDGYAYCKINNVPAPQSVIEHAKGRYDIVFFLESLGTYMEDGIRSRKLEDAERIHAQIKEAYLEFGYNPIVVPVLPPEQRMEFILNMVK